MLLRLACLFVVAGAAAGCGNPLFSPCNGQIDCAGDLRCIDLGGDQRICTKPCTTTKASAGYPDGFDNPELFTDGSSVQATIDDPECADAPVDVSSQDNQDENAQNLLVESAGVVGVCTLAPSLLADTSISGDSLLLGFCAPR